MQFHRLAVLFSIGLLTATSGASADVRLNCGGSFSDDAINNPAGGIVSYDCTGPMSPGDCASYTQTITANNQTFSCHGTGFNTSTSRCTITCTSKGFKPIPFATTGLLCTKAGECLEDDINDGQPPFLPGF